MKFCIDQTVLSLDTNGIDLAINRFDWLLLKTFVLREYFVMFQLAYACASWIANPYLNCDEQPMESYGPP